MASTYNNIWKTGDPSSADEVLAEDFEQVCQLGRAHGQARRALVT